MKTARAVPDLLTPLATAASLDAGLGLTLRRLVRFTGASSGALAFRPARGESLVVVAGESGATAAALRELVTEPPEGARRAARQLGRTGAGARRVIRCLLLGAPRRPVGALALVGRAGTRPPVALPGGFGRELGEAIEQVWRLQQRTLRLTVHNEITRLLVSGDSVDEVLRVFAEGLGRLVDFDGLAVALLDPERPEFEVMDVLARSVPHVTPRDGRMGLDRTLLAQVVASAAPVRIDDLETPVVQIGRAHV